MAFSERLIERVRNRSAFRCCRCEAIGIEVHHIVPQAQGGPDTQDNAAPLCPNCHTWFGDNPVKRKEIRQMRDWWYGVCERRYGGREDETARKLNDLLAEVRDQSSRGDERQEAIDEINRVLRRLVEDRKPKAADSATEIAAKVNEVVSATRLGQGVYANVMCKRCNSYTGLLIGSDTCPSCGAPLS